MLYSVIIPWDCIEFGLRIDFHIRYFIVTD